MKTFLLAAVLLAFACAGCERHPVSQLREIDERSEANPEKKKSEAAEAEGRPEATPRASPRGYFPADTP